MTSFLLITAPEIATVVLYSHSTDRISEAQEIKLLAKARTVQLQSPHPDPHLLSPTSLRTASQCDIIGRPLKLLCF